jgi:hypothetical protein
MSDGLWRLIIYLSSCKNNRLHYCNTFVATINSQQQRAQHQLSTGYSTALLHISSSSLFIIMHEINDYTSQHHISSYHDADERFLRIVGL